RRSPTGCGPSLARTRPGTSRSLPGRGPEVYRVEPQPRRSERPCTMTAPDAMDPPDPPDPAAARGIGAPPAVLLPAASSTRAPTGPDALRAERPVASAGHRRRGVSRRALLPLALAATALAACTPDTDETDAPTETDSPSETGSPSEAGSPTETDGSFTSTPGEEPVPGTEDIDAGDPQPFTDAQLDADYPSDRTVDHVPMLSGFTTLREEHPEVLEENLDRALRINRDADEQEAAAAVTDHYGDMSYTMADGLGKQLGAIYQAAVDAGRLPRTTQLIRQDGGRARNVSTARAKEHFDYERPFVAAPEEHVPRDKDGGDAYETTSAAYPSGHTTEAYWQGTLLATLLPQLAPQILARVSEAGHHRIVLAMHYPLDVIGGRMMGQSAAARRWADEEFRTLLEEARAELHAVLAADCGGDLAGFIAEDAPYLSDEDASSLYRERLTYGFEQIGPDDLPLEVPPEAGTLLRTSHPRLDASQRLRVLELTAMDSGYPLDRSADAAASWQRLDLCAAMSTTVTIAADG